MLGNNILEKSEKYADSAPCRPDPEDMLQAARKRKEKIVEDIASFRKIDSYYPCDEKALAQVFGSMHVALYDAEDNEQYWLNEIDKD